MTIKETLKFESDLYKLINSCGLPLDTAFYVLKSVYLDFQKTVYEYANKETSEPVTQEQIDYNLQKEIKEISSNEQPITTSA